MKPQKANVNSFQKNKQIWGGLLEARSAISTWLLVLEQRWIFLQRISPQPESLYNVEPSFQHCPVVSSQARHGNYAVYSNTMLMRSDLNYYPCYASLSVVKWDCCQLLGAIPSTDTDWVENRLSSPPKKSLELLVAIKPNMCTCSPESQLSCIKRSVASRSKAVIAHPPLHSHENPPEILHSALEPLS